MRKFQTGKTSEQNLHWLFLFVILLCLALHCNPNGAEGTFPDGARAFTASPAGASARISSGAAVYQTLFCVVNVYWCGDRAGSEQTESQRGLTDIAQVQVYGQKKLCTAGKPAATFVLQLFFPERKIILFICGLPCGSLGFIPFLSMWSRSRKPELSGFAGSWKHWVKHPRQFKDICFWTVDCKIMKWKWWKNVWIRMWNKY